jgi:membrane protein implicated in regulation of membrane protease activity
MFGNPRLLFWITLLSALVVGGIIALAVNQWWVILIPLALHGIATTLFTRGIFKVLDEGDKPDPVTQARLDEENKRTATS